MESMKDFEKELEESFKYMGDGAHSTDELVAWENLGKLMEEHTDIDVEILDTTRGGAICEVEGIRGFIPISRLSLDRIEAEDLPSWVGKTLSVRVITADMDEDELVLSATERLRELKENALSSKISEMKVGFVLEGEVGTIKDYGAFIDLDNGLSGLCHISQISEQRISHPTKVLKTGDRVRVKIIDIKDNKLSLSIKELEKDEREAEEQNFELPETESVGTSLGDLFKNLKLN